MYIQPSIDTDQSQLLVSSSKKPAAAHATGRSMPMARESGSQNTLKPYAIPIDR